MYSDDSDDDDIYSYSRAALVLHPSEQIDLRLYHNEELEARSLEKLGQTIGRISSDHTEEDTEHYKKYRVCRFFKTLEGYYLGNLDLSGRHADRFKSVQRRWNNYLVEFLQLTLRTQDIEHGGVLYADYEFSDPSIWDDFTYEWKIPPSIGYGQLYNFTHGVLRTLSSNPTPRIQTLCLHHLPTELLDNIFGHMCIDTARTLALTSRRFKEVGSRYIYADRKLTLRCSFNWKSFGESRNPSTYLDKIARSDREIFSSTAAMILSRPDHVNKMQTTSLSDHWRSHNFDRTVLEGFTLSQIEPNFYNPIYQTCAKVLAAGRNLVSVSLDSLFLTFDIVQSLSDLHHLHTLTLRGCLVSAYIQQKLVPPNNALLLSVYNLNLQMERSSVPWYMLCVCPQLRTLMVAGSDRMELSCPPLEIWHHCAFFPTLERLALNNINSDHLILFADWFRSMVLTSTIPLTHLKLHSRRGIPDGSMINLLEALQHTSLKVLVFEGLAGANFPLFQWIGEFFGETLVALSLTRRASNRQLKNEPVIWPHASWEYAPYFRTLTQLEHFEWNVKWLDTPLALYVLERFEHGFSDGDESAKVGFYEQNNYPDYAERCELAGQMALPFAAHCPTLQTYASAGGHPHSVCKISRAPNGAILVQTPAVESANFNPMNILRWNPSNSLSGAWPPIRPGDTQSLA